MQLGRCFTHAFAEDGTDGLFNSKFSGSDVSVSAALRDALVGTLVLLPDANVGAFAFGRVRDLLARAAFFERRADIERCSFCRKHHGEHALAAPPANASEVVQRGALH